MATSTHSGLSLVQRVAVLLARLRDRQLKLAMAGRHVESAHYAGMADRVARFALHAIRVQ